MDKTIEKLKNDADYYGDFGKKFLSNSDIGVLLKYPKGFKQNKEQTLPMLHGSYLHAAVLEPEKLADPQFACVDVSSRNTKVYKQMIADAGVDRLMLQKEKDNLDKMVSKLKSNLEIYDMIYAPGNKFEQPWVEKIHGEMWKGKIDIVCNDCNIDIKTTSDITKFKWSVRDYNYDSQAYLYELGNGKPLKFIVIDKNTLAIGIFGLTSETLLNGRSKVLRAIEVYNKYFGENATENIEDYIIKGDI